MTWHGGDSYKNMTLDPKNDKEVLSMFDKFKKGKQILIADTKFHSPASSI